MGHDETLLLVGVLPDGETQLGERFDAVTHELD
jgi:hypothetical protein